MHDRPEPLTLIRTAISASATAPDTEIAAFYLALARVSFAKLQEDMKTIEAVLVAREREHAQAVRPKQLAKESGG
jgi:hypothetical protein